MTHYALGTFSLDGTRRFGAMAINGRAAALSDLVRGVPGVDPMRWATVLGVLEDWDENRPVLDALAAQPPQGVTWHALDMLYTHPPVDLPRQVFCTGANYRKHVVDLTVDSGVGPEGLDSEGLRTWAEQMMDARVAHGEPYVFSKPVSAIAGAFDTLVLPANTTKPDWELELAVVIGRGGQNIRREDAMAHVAGYTIANDISARDLIARTDYAMLGTDWLKSKGQPGFLPLGPLLTPARFVPDPHRLRLRLSVSGRTMQDETTADMLFGIERQIEYISRYCRLLPGDVICTGSPAGNGTHYGRFLQDGDVMEAEIEGLGVQKVHCVVQR
ncbi:fumarylacetoacetate hydrolase family protein [Aquabacterium sp.]|uniref:fumarylacetoacetate hydrolase family protein n=1 Tax=Aquabacterium sp. TaxID=1872578 RepID=UPI003BAFB98E